MFDFDNTPITHHTKLKAQYFCEPEQLLSYYGDWARITLNDGTVLEVQSESELNSLLPATSTASVSGQTIQVNQIKGIEFGTKVKSIPNGSMNLGAYWTSLVNFSGFHEGLTTVGTNVFGGSTTTTSNAPIADFTIIFPSTITSVAQSIGAYTNRFVGTIIMNNSNPTNLGTSYFFQTSDPNAPSYTTGVKIRGVYADNLISKYPNLNGSSWYRNLYNGNNLTDFFTDLQRGTAQDVFPTGALLLDLYNKSTSFYWRIVHYGSATLSDGSTGYGAYLWAMVNMGAGSTTSPDYGVASLSTGVEQLFANISDDVKGKVVPIKVPYVYSGVQKTVDAHMWLLSVVEVNGVAQASYGAGGYPFDYFSGNGTVAPTNSALDARKTSAYLNAANVALRSAYNSSNVNYAKADGSIAYATYNSSTITSTKVAPCVFVPGLIRVIVKFNANGGTPEPLEQRVLIGRYATKPEPDPVREGEEFVGWFLLGETYDFVGQIPVMFRMNGGTPQVPVQYVKTGEYAEQPTEGPVREGYEFLGWYEAGTVPDDWDGISVI